MPHVATFKSTEVCEVLQVVLECDGNLVEHEVALNYNGVDGHAVCHEGLHNAVDAWTSYPRYRIDLCSLTKELAIGKESEAIKYCNVWTQITQYMYSKRFRYEGLIRPSQWYPMRK